MLSKQRQPDSVPKIVIDDGAVREAASDVPKLGHGSADLEFLLREHILTRPQPQQNNESEYWTEKELKRLLRRPEIKKAFKHQNLEHLNDKIDIIMTNHIKILAVLALMSKLKRLDEFLVNLINDEDLPLIKCASGSPAELQISQRTDKDQPLALFKSWKTCQRDMFLKYQYKVSPPILTMKLGQGQAKHENYLEQTIMPWTSPLSEKEVGGYSQVFEVEIHPDCHNFGEVFDSLSFPRGNRFAIKKLTKANDQDALSIGRKFDNERAMLERFRGHPHLVTLLMSWTLKEEHYFLFPYAEADLDRYWSLDTNWHAVNSSDPELRYRTMKWISEQILGLVEALAHIHNLDRNLHPEKSFGRHGDLKPENVLWYRSTKDTRGSFIIADLGLAACNSEHSRSGVPVATIARTPSYRSPECDLKDGKISRSYDIWTMGCLLLEMVCWIVGGPVSRNDFAHERLSTAVTGSRSEIFFDVQENSTRSGFVMVIKKSVEEQLAKLHQHKACTQYLHEMLDLIEKHMLVVLCKIEGKIRDRIASEDLLARVRNMHNNVLRSRDYCLKSNPKKRAPIHADPVDADLDPQYLKIATDLRKKQRLTVHSRTPRAALSANEY